MDKVSVYMPTKDRPKMAIRAVSSVLEQSYRNIEMIVVDDGSSRDNQRFLKSQIPDDERVKLIFNKESGGACSARNLAIDAASGRYIAGIDDDDEWLFDRLDCFISEALALEQFSFLYAGDVYECGDGVLRAYPKKDFSRSEFLRRNIVGNQIFTLTERLRDIRFDELMPSAQDYDCFMRLYLKYGPPKYISKVTQILHVGHGLNQITSSDRKILGYKMFFERYNHLMNSAERKYYRATIRALEEEGFTLGNLFQNLTLRNVKRYVFDR